MENEAVDILLVEDNPDDVELTRRALRNRNIVNPIRVVEDGAAALDLLIGPGSATLPRLPHVVFLDLKLPKISGLEVLERLRADERTRNLPVVVLSSSREEPDVQRAYALGANSYVVKPVQFEAFVDAVAGAGYYWVALNLPPA